MIKKHIAIYTLSFKWQMYLHANVPEAQYVLTSCVLHKLLASSCNFTASARRTSHSACTASTYKQVRLHNSSHACSYYMTITITTISSYTTVASCLQIEILQWLLTVLSSSFSKSGRSPYLCRCPSTSRRISVKEGLPSGASARHFRMIEPSDSLSDCFSLSRYLSRRCSSVSISRSRNFPIGVGCAPHAISSTNSPKQKTSTLGVSRANFLFGSLCSLWSNTSGGRYSSSVNLVVRRHWVSGSSNLAMSKSASFARVWSSEWHKRTLLLRRSPWTMFWLWRYTIPLAISCKIRSFFSLETNFPLNLLMNSYSGSSQSSITIDTAALSLYGSSHIPNICTMFLCCILNSIWTVVLPGSGVSSFWNTCASSLKTFTAQGLPLYSPLYTLAKEPSPSLLACLFRSLMTTESGGRKSSCVSAADLLGPPPPVTDDHQVRTYTI